MACCATPAAAQRYGQWWWDASVGYRDRSDRREVDSVRTRDYTEEELRFSLGLNGYVLHPAIGQFRIGADYRTLGLTQAGIDSSDRLGYSLDLQLLPRGLVSGKFRYSRETIDYELPPEAESFLRLRLPESGTAFRGSFRIRRGPLVGTQVGYNRSEYSYGAEAERKDLFENSFLDWARPIGGIQNHFRLGRQQRSYASVEYDSSYLLASFDQNGPLGDKWTWLLAANAQRSELTLQDTALPRQDDLRYRQRLGRSIRDRDRLDLRLEVASVSTDLASTLGYGAGVDYRYRPRPGWEIVPFVRLDVLEDGSESLRAPRLGIELTRFWEASRWSGLLGSRLAYGNVRRARDSEIPNGSDYGFSVSASLARGDVQSLRTEIEGELGRGEFRFSERVDLAPTGAGFQAAPLGEEDFGRLRLRLTRRLGTARLSGWIEWSGRRITPLDRDQPVDRRALTTTIEAGRGRVSFVGNLGRVRVDAEPIGERSSFAVGTLAWRPFRPFELRASYRQDTRDLDELAQLDAARLDVGASFQAGLLTFSVTAYRTWEKVMANGEAQNEGILFSIQRQFAGWLPVVTGERRKGTIR